MDTCKDCDFHTVAITSDFIGDIQHTHVCWRAYGSPEVRMLANRDADFPPACCEKQVSVHGST